MFNGNTFRDWPTDRPTNTICRNMRNLTMWVWSIKNWWPSLTYYRVKGCIWHWKLALKIYIHHTIISVCGWRDMRASACDCEGGYLLCVSISSPALLHAKWFPLRDRRTGQCVMQPPRGEATGCLNLPTCLQGHLWNLHRTDKKILGSPPPKAHHTRSPVTIAHQAVDLHVLNNSRYYPLSMCGSPAVEMRIEPNPNRTRTLHLKNWQEPEPNRTQ